MNIPFKVLVPAIGGLLLLTISIVFYRSHRVASVEPSSYQAAALDNLAPPPPVTQEVVESEKQVEVVVAQTIAELPVFTSAPVVIEAPAVEPPVAPVVAAPTVPAPPPVLTTPVGVGGTLTNRPVESASTESSPPPAPPPALSESDQDRVSTSETSSSTEVLIETQATSTPPVETNDLSSVFISEIFIDMVGGDTEEFVELYNPGTSTANLASSSLQYLSGSASGIGSLVKKNFPLGAAISANEYYLVGLGNYTATTTADMIWSQSLSNTGATLLLVANQEVISGADDLDILDRIAYGSGTLLLAAGDSPVSLPPVGQSLERTSHSATPTEQVTPNPQHSN